MRRLFLAATCLAGLVAIAHGEDAKPAGYVIATDLQGADRVAGTVVVRAGAELKPKIWMPLYAGDVVFVRDPASHVTLDMGGDGRIVVGGGLTRYEAKGEIATEDDAWSIITKIGSIMASSEDEVVPENLSSKGDDTLLPITANNGPNMIVSSDAPLLLAWKGGTAPFAISMKQGKEEHKLSDTPVRLIELALPAGGKDFDIVITDARGLAKRLPFKIRKNLPEAPASLAAAGPSNDFDSVLLAAWLAERPRGAWRLEALRRLQQLKNKDAAAARLFKAMVAG